MIFSASGSKTITSASLPGLITPFLGYKLKIYAALVEVNLTKSMGEKYPELTALVQVTFILSSIPLHPLGIVVNCLLPKSYLV